MTRSDLIELLAARFPLLTAKDVDASVREITDAISLALLAGRRTEIRGFGCFALNYRPPRIGRNPKSGEVVNVPEKWVPHFKAGKEMREAVDASARPVLARKVA
ncbi:integration host factor subunit beta [Propionivibrio dicarboxylicus]|uniref:Integration host factor subunit beta n=1 Tax=Propionivibrio dicarboxylicus TaxID=83767 RepID=A0A1G8JKQ9_9RHOO|nr:integration host factor subunit beta [Propionivibrio dicarboxylicus]SDI31879.1 integration host factor subunit beta [Propionivibrio dicarboxylicus]